MNHKRKLLPAARAGRPFPVIAMAASEGGLHALSVILGRLPADFPAAIAIVMHLAPHHKSALAEILDRRCPLEVREAKSGETLCPSCVFIAPPNQHLSVDRNGRLTLSSSAAEKVHHARPSADPLFVSVAKIFQARAMAVVLTGGDCDGSFGVQIIKDQGGVVIAQDRPTSENFSMPGNSIETGYVDFILPLEKIGPKLIELVGAASAFPQVQPPARSRRRPSALANGLTLRYPAGTKITQAARKKKSAMKKKSPPALRRKLSVKVVSPESPVTFPSVLFPIVGIGASAGGIEALEQFLRQVPPNSGVAFVIIQHLNPTRQGLLPELLQRDTTMKVVQVTDRTKVQPNCVYVIPPNKDMSLLQGVLHLRSPASARGLRLPIDFFFRSLAQDRREHSIGVILSGMGSDGMLGLRAIKEQAGLVLVQDPATAKFDSMPRSVVEAGLADVVAPAAELPGRILTYLERSPLLGRTDTALDDKAQNALGKILLLLRAHTGHDFSHYKRNTLQRRIERRMGLHQIYKIAVYVRYLEENSQELDLLFKELLIGVTNFFRDPIVWEELSTHVLPALLAKRKPGETLRAWVPGCSTGEEAYSLAMVFKEAVQQGRFKEDFHLQIFATDLDRDAITKARQGVFPANITADVAPERLQRYFAKEEHGFRVRKEIREMVIFAPQNLIMDPPFTKLDILCCRNLLIYLSAEVQKKLIPLFHYSLNPEGILLQGSAETIGDYTDLFTPLHAKARIFRRKETALRPDHMQIPVSFKGLPPVMTDLAPTAKAPPNLQSMADQLVLDRYAPPSVLTNAAGDIFYVSGRTGKYLEPASGKANWNIFVMAREGLRYELAGAFKEVLKKKENVALRGLTVGTNGGKQCVNVTLQLLQNPGALQGLVLIVFTDVPVPAVTKAAARALAAPRHPRLADLERKLQQAQIEARATREDMQTSQEEYRSANEELQSINEEMQSTNEELMTSKEELQSLNEELHTVNTELQIKADEHLLLSNDLKNLFESTEIATLFLDRELLVRRFTPPVTKIIKLIPADVGRPITDLVSHVDGTTLADDVCEVLRTLVSTEKPVATKDGRRFNVRIMPYRTQDDRIDGVVVTFANLPPSQKARGKSARAKGTSEKNAVKAGGKRPRRPT